MRTNAWWPGNPGGAASDGLSGMFDEALRATEMFQANLAGGTTVLSEAWDTPLFGGQTEQRGVEPPEVDARNVHALVALLVVAALLLALRQATGVEATELASDTAEQLLRDAARAVGMFLRGLDHLYRESPEFRGLVIVVTLAPVIAWARGKLGRSN